MPIKKDETHKEKDLKLREKQTKNLMQERHIHEQCHAETAKSQLHDDSSMQQHPEFSGHIVA